VHVERVRRDAKLTYLPFTAKAVATALRNFPHAKKLTLDDFYGGTFTITNPGPFGTLISGPIVNQPQVAILSADGIKKRPVVVETLGDDDEITVHPVGNLSLSFDHRAFDGAYAARFIGRTKQILEADDWTPEFAAQSPGA